MKNTLLVFCALWLLFSIAGCNKKACERTCECQEGYDADPKVLEECIKNCLDILDKAKDDCQDAFRDYARCQDRYNCENNTCGADFNVYNDKCEYMNLRRQPNNQEGGSD